MNRIILIGNGFDKAHGLPTGYEDFVKDYWVRWIDDLEKNHSRTLTDSLCTFNVKEPTWNWNYVISEYKECTNSKQEILDYIRRIDDFAIRKSAFWTSIENSLTEKRWVDIENEYYKFLSNISKGKRCGEYDLTINKLNEQLNALKNKLASYLSDIQKTHINKDIIHQRIIQILYEPFRVHDISVKGRELFKDFIRERWTEEIKKIDGYHMLRTLQRFVETTDSQDVKEYFEWVLSTAKQHKRDAIDEHWNNIFYPNKNSMHTNAINYLLLPERIMLLTFNYTNTADLYKINENPNIEINHIHGELANLDSIIFGYGDDTDEEYARIEKLNDNAYMNNIKAFQYLSSANYRRMLEFIEAAPYQIYIMGHSCGTSDRTLLNTLFEHDNCISIKPYYYQKEDGTDNYIELVQNISRNFKSRPKMRDRVVNKTFCEPLMKLDSKN